MALVDSIQLVVSNDEQIRRVREGAVDDWDIEDGVKILEEIGRHKEKNLPGWGRFYFSEDEVLDAGRRQEFMNRFSLCTLTGNEVIKSGDLPDDNFRRSTHGLCYGLTGIYVSIPFKDRPVRFGRNRNF